MREKLCSKSSIRPEAEGRRLHLRPKVQFNLIETDRFAFSAFFRDWRGRDSGLSSLFCKNPWPIKLEDLRVRPAEEFKKKKNFLYTTGSNKDNC